MFREIRTREKITDKCSNNHFNPDDLWDIFQALKKDPNYKYYVVTDNTFDIDRPTRNHKRAFVVGGKVKPSSELYPAIGESYDTREAAEVAAEAYNANL